MISPVNEEEVMEVDKPVIEDRGDTLWLTKQLPLLPHFKVARAQVNGILTLIV